MNATCKFCGGPLSAGNGDWRYCPTCGNYCMQKCKISAIGVTWHTEPCVSCEHNPYKLRHVWDGKKWIREDKNARD